MKSNLVAANKARGKSIKNVLESEYLTKNGANSKKKKFFKESIREKARIESNENEVNVDVTFKFKRIKYLIIYLNFN